MSLLNRIGKKYIEPVSPLLEPPPLSDNIEEYVRNVTKWATTKSSKPNCPKVYMLWKISQQEKHINRLEEMLEMLIHEVAVMKGEKLMFNCAVCRDDFSDDECDCIYSKQPVCKASSYSYDSEPDYDYDSN